MSMQRMVGNGLGTAVQASLGFSVVSPRSSTFAVPSLVITAAGEVFVFPMSSAEKSDYFRAYGPLSCSEQTVKTDGSVCGAVAACNWGGCGVSFFLSRFHVQNSGDFKSFNVG